MSLGLESSQPESKPRVCDHVCRRLNHFPLKEHGYVLNCCNFCPGCRQPIKYGSLNEHLRESHGNTKE